jgi:predicted transcriptional regulator of viral defense system
VAKPIKRQWLAAIRADPAIRARANVLSVAVDLLAHPDASELGQYECNQRATAERLGITRVTVTRALGTLVEHGYLERLTRGGSTHASRYRVLPRHPPDTQPRRTHWYKIYTNIGINE